jgi:subtilisin-like proprotein convertase family protein
MTTLGKLAALCCCLWGLSGVLCAENTSTVRGNFSQPIPAQGDGYGWMDPVTLDVTSHWQIIDIDVHLDITHSDIRDLAIMLDCPWGQTIAIKDSWQIDFGDAIVNMYDTIFNDDAAAEPIAGKESCVPAEPLATFNGFDAYGLWHLRIYDAYYADTGTLDSWELHITHAPEPAAMLYLFCGLAGLIRHRHRQ